VSESLAANCSNAQPAIGEQNFAIRPLPQIPPAQLRLTATVPQANWRMTTAISAVSIADTMSAKRKKPLMMLVGLQSNFGIVTV
jgi:hypothetical protein